MRCVALLSGGKDSVAAIDVARGHGWEVPVALCIVPAEDDAWMFHTPNLAVVDAVAQALDLELVRAPCRSGPEEEVADLETALAQVKEEHDVGAVVSGALASEYQRTRIDAIGHRLGLATFAPLWHVDPDTYMDGLVAAGYDIRIARAAADGLDETWAGRRLDAQALAELRANPSRPHIAGEGGEFETLVLDGPGYQKRIEVEEEEVEATASRSTWHVKRWRLSAVRRC
ncbi:MAG: diphthine--ammonia ligase [Thermoplasmatota archaeon]